MPSLPLHHHRTQVIAHRGASHAEPENTLTAFAKAVDMGADAVELDVRLSRDGVMVVHHDARLKDGRVIVQTDARELPLYIPALEQALDACSGLWVNIEIKNDPNEPDFDPGEILAAQVADMLRGRAEYDRWLISCFRRETVDAMHALLPDVGTAWLTTGVRDADIASVAAGLRDSGHLALHPWVNLLTEHVIEVCHENGLEVNTWTCDDPARMQQIISWGVDGICTNVPEVAIAVLATP
ncbi:MAG: glycerophosphodiester phosphodiesterase [Ilumatobacteraceae bacterium]|nr:glycerophosphodiester phosphodiesterase [Ilumatobacteraceae bacterium]